MHNHHNVTDMPCVCVLCVMRLSLYLSDGSREWFDVSFVEIWICTNLLKSYTSAHCYAIHTHTHKKHSLSKTITSDPAVRIFGLLRVFRLKNIEFHLHTHTRTSIQALRTFSRNSPTHQKKSIEVTTNQPITPMPVKTMNEAELSDRPVSRPNASGGRS